MVAVESVRPHIVHAHNISFAACITFSSLIILAMLRPGRRPSVVGQTDTRASEQPHTLPHFVLDKLITRSSRRHPVSELSSISTADLRLLVEAIAVPQHGGRKAFLHNWACTYGTYPQMVLKPTTEEEVRYIVELARREGKTVRCFGSLHSPSDIAIGGDYMVSLDDMSGLIEVCRLHHGLPSSCRPGT